MNEKTSFIQNKWLVVSIYLTFGLIVFFPGLFAGFLSDDYGFLVEAKNFGWNAFEHNFRDPFFIPFSHILGLIQYQIFGENAFWHHLTQILLHITNAYLIFDIITRFNNDSKKSDNIKLAFWSGLFFLILPYQCEAVIWLSGKSYIYSLLFALLSIKFYLKFQSECSVKFGWLSLLFMGLSMLSKELGYMVLFVIIAIEWYQKNLTHTKKFLIASFTGLAIILSVRYFVLNDLSGGYGAIHYNFSFPLLITHYGAYILKYIGYFRFNTYYIAPTLSLLLLGYGVILNYKKHKRFITLMIILFILTLLPVINLEITSWKSIESDRYSYFTNVIYAVSVAAIIIYLKNNLFKNVTLMIISIFFFVTAITSSFNWKEAGELTQTYLSELAKIPEDTIILLNAPDNLNGSYVLRNGISQYLELNKINKEVEIITFQTFYSKNGGLEYSDGDFRKMDAKAYYSFNKSGKPYDFDSENPTPMYSFYQGKFKRVK